MKMDGDIDNYGHDDGNDVFVGDGDIFLMIMDLVLKISAFCNVLEKFLTKIARDFW